MFVNKINTLAEEIIQSGKSRVHPDEASALIPQNPGQILDLIHGADRIRRRFKQQQAFTCAIVGIRRITALPHVYKAENLSLYTPEIFVLPASFFSTRWIFG